MSGFSAAWLALREPADHDARSLALTRRVADALASRELIRVADLGAGTGSNRRFLRPLLGAPQQWLLVDDDEQLLDIATRDGGEIARADLSDLRRRGPSWSAILGDRHLVTASALLDLVSADWLAALVDLCADAGAIALFTLSYDGRIQCSPAESGDTLVKTLVNAHQRRDKGFGPALGAGAAALAEELFSARGYTVYREPSDWELTADLGELQRALIEGWAAAAVEQDPSRADAIASWRTRRLGHVKAGASTLVVGHQDVAAIPG